MIQWVSDNPLESRMDEFAFDDFLMCCVYGFAPRKIISKLKFEGANYLAKPLAKLMAEQSSRFNESFDAVCFIPSSKEKLAKRGYNQSELLARHIAKSLGLPLLNALQKPAETKSLRLSSGRERQGIISGAFELNNKCEIKKGSVLLLVDDVLTTGSTASEASRILHYGGAAKVCVLVFAGPSGVMYQQYDKE